MGVLSYSLKKGLKKIPEALFITLEIIPALSYGFSFDSETDELNFDQF